MLNNENNSFKNCSKRKGYWKEKIRNDINYALMWINNNKDVLVIIVPAATAIIGGAFKLGKGISRNIAIKQETRMRDMRIYDRSLGKYVELKRPLTQKDMSHILERKENGEKLSNILMDLNLIK